MNELRAHLKELKAVYPKLDAYLLGLKHGISLVDLDHYYDPQLKEIEQMRQALGEINGQESAPKAHPGG